MELLQKSENFTIKLLKLLVAEMFTCYAFLPVVKKDINHTNGYLLLVLVMKAQQYQH